MKKIILIGLCISLLIITGCKQEPPPPICFDAYECDCSKYIDDVTYPISIDKLPDHKCNCCWNIPVMNDEGYYDLIRKCEGITATKYERCH